MAPASVPVLDLKLKTPAKSTSAAQPPIADRSQVEEAQRLQPQKLSSQPPLPSKEDVGKVQRLLPAANSSLPPAIKQPSRVEDGNAAAKATQPPLPSGTEVGPA